MKNNRILHNEKIRRDILHITNLIDNSWILLSVSADDLLWYVAWVEVCEENTASQKYIVGKGRSVLIAFFHHWQKMLSVVFLDVTGLFVNFWEMSVKSIRLNNHSFVNHFWKEKWRSMEEENSSQSKQLCLCFSLCQPLNLICISQE